jgi:DNA-binding NarL/FixJ family response regulator
MTNQTQNLFIVEDDAQNSLKLHQFLEKRFGTIYNIFTYTNAVQALSKVDENTSVIVLDYGYFGDEGTKIVNFIKNINQKTKVIILSNNEEIGTTIDSYKHEGDGYLLKEKGMKKKLNATILDIVSYPANYLQERYSVSQAFVYFVFLFIILSIIVLVGMLVL